VTESPSHAEREVERARADLSHTLDALKDRLSLGHLFDEVRDQFLGSSSGEFTTNLSRQVRNNPMPAVLVGLGVLWLMMSDRNRPASHAARIYPETGRPGGYTGDGMGERAQQAATQMGMGLRSTAETMREAGADTAERARAAAQGAGQSMRAMASGVSETVSSAGEGAAEWMQSAKEAAQSAGEGASQMGQRTRQTLNEMLEQQPLLVGAMGVALGAVVGALLPTTRLEDEYLGETRDQLSETISEQGAQLYEKGKVAATEAYRAAADEARAQGLVPEETGGKTMAEKAEQVLTKAGEAAKEAGEREMGAEPARGPEQSPGQATGMQPPKSIEPGTPIIPDRPRMPPGRES